MSDSPSQTKTEKVVFSKSPLQINDRQLAYALVNLLKESQRQVFVVKSNTFSRRQIQEALIEFLGYLTDSQEWLSLKPEELENNLETAIEIINQSFEATQEGFTAEKREDLLEELRQAKEKERENPEQRTNYRNLGNITVAEQIKLIEAQKRQLLLGDINRFKQRFFRPIEQRIYDDLSRRYSAKVLAGKQQAIKKSIDLTLEKIFRETGQHLLFNKSLSEENKRYLFNKIFASPDAFIFDKSSIAAIIEGFDQMLEREEAKEAIKDYGLAKKETDPDFEAIVQNYIQVYDLDREKALLAATKANEEIAKGYSAADAYTKGLLAVGFTNKEFRQKISQNPQAYSKSLDDINSFFVGENLGRVQTVRGELRVDEIEINGRLVKISEIQTGINQQREKQGLSLLSRRQIEDAYLVNVIAKATRNELDKGIDLDKENRLNEKLWQARENFRYLSQSKYKAEAISVPKENGQEIECNYSFSDSAVGRGLKFAGGWAAGEAKRWVGKGIKKGGQKVAGFLAKKVGIKLGLAATGVGAPVAAILALDDIASAVPIVGKVYSGLKKRFNPFSKKNLKRTAVIGGAAAIGLGALLKGLLSKVMIGANTLLGSAAGGMIGFAVGGPIGAGIGSIIGGLSGGAIKNWMVEKGGIQGILNKAGSAAQNVVNNSGAAATASETAGGGFALGKGFSIVNAPLIAVGATFTMGTVYYLYLSSVFTLPPYEKLSDFFERGNNIERTCLDESGNKLKIPDGFAEGSPVGGCVTAGVNTHTGYSTHYNAIDIACNSADDVQATHDGVVLESGFSSVGFGNFVLVQGETEIDGEKIVFRTLYAHLEDIAGSIYKGRQVSKGDLLGIVGSTGNSTGPHLHYELLMDETNIYFAKISVACTLSLSESELERVNGGCVTAKKCNVTIR